MKNFANILSTTIILLLCCITSNYAQNTNTTFVKYGKTSISEFNDNDLVYSDYDAVVLQNEKKMYFDQYNNQLRLYNVYHIKLKALKDNFEDQETFTIDYSGRFDYEKVIDIKFNICKLNGSKVSVTKLKYKNFETIDKDSINSKIKIKLPSISKNDIIDLEYTIITFDFIRPPNWNFNHKYPCLKSALTTEFPTFMMYKYQYRGIDTSRIRHSNNPGYCLISYQYSPQDSPQSLYYMMGRTRRFPINYRFNSNVDSFVVSGIIPPKDICEQSDLMSVKMKAARFTQNISYSGIYLTAWKQFTQLIYTYADPDNRYISQSEAWFKMYNAGFMIVSSQDWKRVHKSLWKSNQFWKQILKSVEIPPQLQSVYDPDIELDTLKATYQIYNYVKNNIQWNNECKNHLETSINNVLKRKQGNIAEINLTLTSLLRHNGISAYPALTATLDYEEVDTAYANTIQFDTVLTCVEYNNHYIILNAADNYPAINRLIWIVKPEDGEFAEISQEGNTTIASKFIIEVQF